MSIEVHDTSVDASPGLERGIEPGSYVVLTVTDAGCGMDAVTRERIIEPFFTTKEVEKGTGLGLSTVFGIVKQSRGHVEVDTEPGRGTSFRVSLPRAEQEVAATPASSISDAPGGSETILLVEDDAPLRVMMRSILSRHGYNVLDAQNAGEAFLVSEENAKIHLLRTNVVMPRMSGYELAQRLAAAKPEMRVLYLSGQPESTVVRRGVLGEDHALLQKPVTPIALLREVREVREVRDAPRQPSARPIAARDRPRRHTACPFVSFGEDDLNVRAVMETSDRIFGPEQWSPAPRTACSRPDRWIQDARFCFSPLRLD